MFDPSVGWSVDFSVLDWLVGWLVFGWRFLGVFFVAIDWWVGFVVMGYDTAGSVAKEFRRSKGSDWGGGGTGPGYWVVFDWLIL